MLDDESGKSKDKSGGWVVPELWVLIGLTLVTVCANGSLHDVSRARGFYATKV